MAVIAYVAESAASAPLPRGLPLSVQAPVRHSSAPAAPVRAQAGGGDDWDEGESVAPIEPPAADTDGPSLEELESQMGGGFSDGDQTGSATRARSPKRERRAASADEAADAKGLPDLDALVARLPAEVKDALDELFRARFVSVKRVPVEAISSGAPKRAGLID